VSSGPIACAPGETWANINARLEQGGRGLLGGLSLAQLLSKHRGVPNQSDLPPITEEQILQWVHAYVNRASEWPTRESQIIHEAPHEIWKAVDMALRKGLRGLPGASSLARFLAEKLGRRNPGNLPPLTVEWILKMAESHHERTGQWPNSTSGPILDAPGETWSGINSALQQGSRRLPIRSSLAQLLQDHFGVRNRKKLPDLTIEQILAWVDQHLERTGEWPNHLSGNIPDQPNETWSGINHVLLRGSRGLATSCSLADLLAQYRGVRNIKNPPKFTESQIFAWAVAYKKRTGNWPRVRSGPIFECPDETWRRIDNALVHGLRGLPGGSSLVRLIQEHLNPSIS
jgi:pyrroloquinoline quinone (PQQ) biosynthesis protein C